MKIIHKRIMLGLSIALSGLSLVSLPVYAQDMASPPNSLVVDDTGKVGIGTATPTNVLHIQNENALVRIENTSAVKESRDIIRLENKGAVNFKLRDTFLGGIQGEWTFRTDQNGNAFVIGKTTSGVTEMRLYGGGNMEIAGALSEGSSRSIKENIVGTDSLAVLNKVIDLPISNWSYIHDGGKVRHIGPMAEDFHLMFGVGKSPKTISTVDTGGVALAAIKGLNEVVKEKDAKIEELRLELDELKELVHELVAKNKVAMNQLR